MARLKNRFSKLKYKLSQYNKSALNYAASGENIFLFSLKTLSLVEDSVVNGGGVSAPLLNESCFEREKENIIATSGVVKGRLIVLG